MGQGRLSCGGLAHTRNQLLPWGDEHGPGTPHLACVSVCLHLETLWVHRGRKQPAEIPNPEWKTKRNKPPGSGTTFMRAEDKAESFTETETKLNFGFPWAKAKRETGLAACPASPPEAGSKPATWPAWAALLCPRAFSEPGAVPTSQQGRVGPRIMLRPLELWRRCWLAPRPSAGEWGAEL